MVEGTGSVWAGFARHESLFQYFENSQNSFFHDRPFILLQNFDAFVKFATESMDPVTLRDILFSTSGHAVTP